MGADGAGIAVYDDAVLTVNGGSISNNRGNGEEACYGIGVYVNDSTATFNGVKFENNHGFDEHHYGAAIYAEDSKVTMYDCTVDGNGVKNNGTATFVNIPDSKWYKTSKKGYWLA
jgi:hypothetical protein